MVKVVDCQFGINCYVCSPSLKNNFCLDKFQKKTSNKKLCRSGNQCYKIEDENNLAKKRGCVQSCKSYSKDGITQYCCNDHYCNKSARMLWAIFLTATSPIVHIGTSVYLSNIIIIHNNSTWRSLFQTVTSSSLTR
ncbi:hypothetical protein SNEBB_011229 [Seison nebaliae]|nr:hypothetical protein SNEBB_011229 [Seison nebaliae]